MTVRFFGAACAIVVAAGAIPLKAGVKEGVEKWQAGDHKAAVVEWLPYAAKGDPDALFNLGQAYKLGRGVPIDLAKAEDFYRRAADKGHAPAQSNLGIILAQRGDKPAAVALWQKAAEKKDARAQYMLGVMHFNGDTVEKNWPLAYAYMTQASNAGLPQAGRALSTMNANMPQSDRDRGLQMAGALVPGDRLASSGKALPQPRKIANDIAAVKLPKPSEAVAEASSSRTSPAPRQAAALPPPTPTPAPIKLASAPTPKPQKTVVAAAAIPDPIDKALPNGRWRVQLGAYSQEARAREAWAELRRQQAAVVGGAQPFYVAGGNVVRLQIGSFANAAEAGSLCRDLKTSGRACFVVEAN